MSESEKNDWEEALGIKDALTEEENEIDYVKESDGVSFFTSLFYVLFICSLVLAIIGVIKMNSINDAKQLVGGDAYNFIIHSITTNGYLILSLISAALSIASVLFAILLRLKAQLQIAQFTAFGNEE